MEVQSHRNRLIGLIFACFFVPFLLGPVANLEGLSRMPADLGDPRLNNYFLESIYQYLLGRSDSLWNLPFFYPFPWVGGFSDNLFGASPVYLLSRFLGVASDTSFQIWFLGAYPANVLASFLALRLLRLSPIAAAFGAVVFSFSLPVSAYIGHAQLHYRFAAPLALSYFASFLIHKNPRALASAALWVVWQFYLTIYIGFFSAVLIAAMALAYLIHCLLRSRLGVAGSIAEFLKVARSLPVAIRVWLSTKLLIALGLMGILFYPYLQVTRLYHIKRGIEEIAIMLPRPESYLYSNVSWVWPFDADYFSWLPNHLEHQMFWGIVPCLLFFLGAVRLFKTASYPEGRVLAAALLGVIAASLFVWNWSAWLLLARLPLFSAIRAVARIDLVFLFPVAFLCGLGMEWLQAKPRWVVVVFSLLIAESVAVKWDNSLKSEWRSRVELKMSQIPKDLAKDSILFFAQGADPYYLEELDAMWAAQAMGYKTLNGYSGMVPKGFSERFEGDCGELIMRAFAYQDLGLSQSMPGWVKNVVPIGFRNCKPLAVIAQMSRSSLKDPYPDGYYEGIELKAEGVEKELQRVEGHDKSDQPSQERPTVESWRTLSDQSVLALAK